MPTIDATSEGPALRVVFVASSPYSGSTLLALLLNAHPDVVSIGEMGPRTSRPPSQYTCSCGVRLGDCLFFADVGRRLADRGLNLDTTIKGLRVREEFGKAGRPLLHGLGNGWLDVRRRQLVSRLLLTRRFNGLRGRSHSFITAVLESSGATVFVDTTKTPARVPFLLTLPQIDLTFLHLVRDPRAQVWSSLRHGGGSLSRHAKTWLRRQREAIGFSASLPESRRLTIRYEDLCASPKQELDRVCSALGLLPMPSLDSYDTFEHHVIGNSMRKATGTRARIDLDTRWRDEMSREQQESVLRITGVWARNFGYTHR